MKLRPAPNNRDARGQSGQAIVEAAFMLPLMIFFILCTLQLTLLQQARILVEYAAFNAARAGIVHNMNNGVDGSDPTSVMRNAAVYSILATYGRSDSMPAITATLAQYEAQDLAMRGAGVPMMKVSVLNPHKADFAAYGAHLNGKEIDFDDMRPAATPTTLLSIEVRYLFELRVPFANKMIQAMWFASQVGLLSRWTGVDATSPGLDNSQAGNAVDASIAAGAGIGILNDGMTGGLNVAALSALTHTNKFFMPVHAYQSMRMQSNPYLQWAAP